MRRMTSVAFCDRQRHQHGVHKWFHICHQQPAATSQDVLDEMSNGRSNWRTIYGADFHLVELLTSMQMFQMSTAGCVTAKPSHRQNVYHIRWTLFGRFFTWLRCSLQGPPDVWDVLRRICHSSKTFTKMFTSPLGCEVQQNIRAIGTFASWKELRCSHIESRMKCTLLSICHSD